MRAGGEREDGQQRGERRSTTVRVRGTTGRRPGRPGVADEQAAAEEHQQPRHGRGREAGHLGERVRDVGEGAEHAAEAETVTASESQTWPSRNAPSSWRSRAVRGVVPGAPAPAARCADERDHADGGDRPEGGAPAELLAEQGAERHAEHVGDRSGRRTSPRSRRPSWPARPRLAATTDADAEERAVAERRDDPAGEHRGVRRGDGREQVADDEQHHQAEQHRLRGSRVTAAVRATAPTATLSA